MDDTKNSISITLHSEPNGKFDICITAENKLGAIFTDKTATEAGEKIAAYISRVTSTSTKDTKKPSKQQLTELIKNHCSFDGDANTRFCNRKDSDCAACLAEHLIDASPFHGKSCRNCDYLNTDEKPYCCRWNQHVTLNDWCYSFIQKG